MASNDGEGKVSDAKLVQYLNEAYAKERELEPALEAHIAMTTKPSYKKRLQQHLKETKAHGRELERRIKKISGAGPATLEKVAGQLAGQAKSLAKGPLHMVRGTGEAEKMLKNAKTEYWNEHEEIATYAAIEALAEALGDSETAKLARSIRRDEERMAKFLETQIPQLTRAVVREEVPAAERNAGSSRGRRRSGSSGARRTSSGGAARSRRSTTTAKRGPAKKAKR